MDEKNGESTQQDDVAGAGREESKIDGLE